MILKHSLKNHLYSLHFLFIKIVILFLIWIYYGFNKDIVVISSLFELLFTFPGLYCHFEYYYKHRWNEIEILDDEIIFNKRGEMIKYQSNELAKITVYKSASLDSRGILFTLLEYYSFARITTISGEEIIITSLITKDINESLENLKGVLYE